MTWNKGGDNQLWSCEGLPLEIDVTVSVKDLYPILMSTRLRAVLKYNRGLLAMLENMAGINTYQLSGELAKRKLNANLNNYGSGITDVMSGRSLRAGLGDIYSSFANAVNNFNL